MIGSPAAMLDRGKIEAHQLTELRALISALLASRSLPAGLPAPRTLGWILAAMVGARSAAMAFNRIADARFERHLERLGR